MSSGRTTTILWSCSSGPSFSSRLILIRSHNNGTAMRATKINHTSTLTPALVSCMLTPHWPKQVAWPFPEREWGTLQSYMAKGKAIGGVKDLGHFCIRSNLWKQWIPEWCLGRPPFYSTWIIGKGYTVFHLHAIVLVALSLSPHITAVPGLALC